MQEYLVLEVYNSSSFEKSSRQICAFRKKIQRFLTLGCIKGTPTKHKFVLDSHLTAVFSKVKGVGRPLQHHRDCGNHPCSSALTPPVNEKSRYLHRST
jgi:hypothetical protein